MFLRSGSTYFFGLITFGAVDPFPFLPFFPFFPFLALLGWLASAISPSINGIYCDVGFEFSLSLLSFCYSIICSGSSGYGLSAAYSAASFSFLSLSILSSSSLYSSSATLIFSFSYQALYKSPTPI